MNEEEIRELYDRLIDHYADAHQLPKLKRHRPEWKILDEDDVKSQLYRKTRNASGTLSFGLWEDGSTVEGNICPSPRIEFYGEPSVETVMHELIHHIIYVIDRCETIVEEDLWNPEDLAHMDEWPF